MDPEYEKELSRLGIKKGHVIEVVVREKSSELPQKGGAILWKTTGNQALCMLLLRLYTRPCQRIKAKGFS